MLKILIAFGAGLTAPITVPKIIEAADIAIERIRDIDMSRMMSTSSDTNSMMDSTTERSGMMTQEEMDDMMSSRNPEDHCSRYSDYLEENESTIVEETV